MKTLSVVAVLLAACGTRSTPIRSTPTSEPAAAVPARPRITSGPAIEYTISFDDAATHYADIEVIAPSSGTVTEVMMPVWTPGSYLVREFSRHIEGLRASTVAGEPLAVDKTRKNRWRVHSGAAERVVLRYRLYCRELSVRTNFVDAELAVINGAATFLTLADATPRPHDVQVRLPARWQRAVTALPAHPGGQPGHYLATDYDQLVDSPIVVGTPAVREFEIDGVAFELALFGNLRFWDAERSARDVQKLAAGQIRFWGGMPTNRYVFINLATGGGGGLEHKQSTLLLSSPFATRTEDGYRRWLGLVSHEFFHTWNVKRLRPSGLGPFDYDNEVYTAGLWIAEGITSYYDDLLLLRTGLIDRDDYLELLSKQIRSVQTRPGRLVQTLAQSSFDAWIKHYRPDENSDNSAISYYQKGAVVGFLLDAEIRRATGGARSLDDLMRLLYQRHSGDQGFTREQFRAAVDEVAGRSLGAFLGTAVDSTDELDYQPALDYFGLKMKRASDDEHDRGDGDEGESGDESDKKNKAWLGLSVSGDARLTVTGVPTDTPAHRAGVNVDDELIAIDDFRLPPDLTEHLEQYRPGDRITLLVARRGALVELSVTLGKKPRVPWKLQISPDATSAQAERLEHWLAPKR